MEQRTDEWHAARLGKITASRIGDMIAKTKSGWSASRSNLAAELALQRITGYAQPGFSNAAMQWGIDTEPAARAAYETRTGMLVQEVGFIDHPSLPMAGASPDGLVGERGLIEIKCPTPGTHIANIQRDGADPAYVPQMQWQMACTGADWCDFVSFDPRFPERHQIYIWRIDRNQQYIDWLEAEAAEFNRQIESIVEKFQ